MNKEIDIDIEQANKIIKNLTKEYWLNEIKQLVTGADTEEDFVNREIEMNEKSLKKSIERGFGNNARIFQHNCNILKEIKEEKYPKFNINKNKIKGKQIFQDKGIFVEYVDSLKNIPNYGCRIIFKIISQIKENDGQEHDYSEMLEQFYESLKEIDIEHIFDNVTNGITLHSDIKNEILKKIEYVNDVIIQELERENVIVSLYNKEIELLKVENEILKINIIEIYLVINEILDQLTSILYFYNIDFAKSNNTQINNEVTIPKQFDPINYIGSLKRELPYIFWQLQKLGMIDAKHLGLTLSNIFLYKGQQIENTYFNAEFAKFERGEFPSNAHELDKILLKPKKQITKL